MSAHRSRAEEPGIADILEKELKEVATVNMRLSNGVNQDDHEEGWYDTLSAASDLEHAAEQLRKRVIEEIRKRDE